ncbi:MAG: cadherin-like beta sandwich domain-containing protein, partial [Clostridia bacterium]|nr:cadherin-like beta sandwich domain-containing protein [Clostridia bacterium]
MKKILLITLTIAALVALVVIPANAASVSLSGPSSAESGSEVTFAVTAGGSEGITGFSATIVPESGLVVESVSGCPSGWMSASNTNAISIAGSNSVTGIEVYIKCKVTGDVGATKTLSLANVKVSDANANDSTLGAPSKSISIAAPKSGENRLASLSVAGYSLSPAFSENTTSYSIGEVPYDVGSVTVNATAKDSAAKVSTQGTALAVGQNYVKVNVTAPNGSVKTYTIGVTRKQDPNYKPSTDGSVAEIAVSYGDLSPAFDSKIKEYVVYVPYEVEKMTVSGRAAAQLAKGVKNIEEQELKVGINELVLQCTAEDDSVTDYTIYVVRMDEFGGKDTVGLPASLINADKPEPEETTEPSDDDNQAEPEKLGNNWLVTAGAGVLCLLIGGGAGFLIPKAIEKRK